MATVGWAFSAGGNWLDGTMWDSGATPAAADDVTFFPAGPYTVSLTSAVTVNSLTFDAVGATLVEGTGATLKVAGPFNLEAGTVALHGKNAFGSVIESGGVLQLYNGVALGSANLTLSAGELSGMATESVGNFLGMSGPGFTIDAATGTTVDFGGGDWSLDDTGHPTIQFGSASRRGTVVWHTPFASISSGGSYLVNIAGGTLKGADINFGFLLGNADSTVVMAAGAAIDLNGFSTIIEALEGSGAVVDSGKAATLILNGGGDFFGVISGPIAVEIVQSTKLLGANTYSGGTTIDSGGTLSLGIGGRIAGPMVDNGTFFNFDTSGGVSLGPISGTGAVFQDGSSTLVLDHADSYSGGTNILEGRVLIGDGAALGTGAVLLDNAELVATATLTMPNALTLRDSVTIAAATGTTLTITGAGSTTFEAGAAPLTVTFGDGANKGTVVVKNTTYVHNGAFPLHLVIAAGTLRVGDQLLNIVMANFSDVKVAAGATLDLGDFALTTQNLTGAGTITNSLGSVATLRTEGLSVVSGVITGNLALSVTGITRLTGADTYVGGTTIASGALLQLGNGAATGSIFGKIDNEGELGIDETGKVFLGGNISGAGSLFQIGAGATTLNGGNTYTGGTTIYRGEIVATHGYALGSGGTLTMTGGELLGAANETLSHDLNTSGAVTIAAAHATSLTLANGSVIVNASRIVFGEGANDGTIVFKVSGSGALIDTIHSSVEVRAGTLKAGDDFGLAFVLGDIVGTTIDAGATLDGGGHLLKINALSGAGTLTGLGGKTFDLTGVSTFSGVIAGAVNIDVFGGTTLTGNETFTGVAQITHAALTVTGLFHEAVQFNAGGRLVLPVPSHFTGLIENFSSGSTVDLRNITTGAGASLSYNVATHVLTVFDGVRTDHLTFAAGLVLGNFKATSDFFGGTNITWRTPPPVTHGAPAPWQGADHNRFVGAMAAFPTPAGDSTHAPVQMGHGADAVLLAPRVQAA
jgi:autotransporter-associated beta strand protein